MEQTEAMRAATSPQEWWEAACVARLNGSMTQVVDRVMHAAKVGAPVVGFYLTDPPPVGTPERDDWERQCDRCEGVMPMEQQMVSLREARMIPGLELKVLMTGALCQGCVDELGLPADQIATEPVRDVTEAMHHLEERFRGGAFTAIVGESADDLGAAVARTQERKREAGL